MNNDLISRSALKKAIEQGEGFSWNGLGKDDLCVRKKYIDNAPTVKTYCYFCGQTEHGIRPQGEWKLHGMIYYCSVCGHDCEQGGNNFCGNCGADMRGDDS